MQALQALFARIHRPSLRHGLFFGLILGGSEIVLSVIQGFVTQPDAQSWLGTAALALFIILAYLAGQRTAREVGRWGAGTAAGLWAGLVGAILWGLGQFIQILIYLPTLVSLYRAYIRANPKQFPHVDPASFSSMDALVANLTPLVFSMLFYLAFAILGGALGGAMGRRRGPSFLRARGADNSDDTAVSAEEA